MKKTSSDTIDAVMRRIASEPVPNEGHLQHPMQPASRKKKGQVTFDDLDVLASVPIDTWTTRTFVDYFAKRYQEEFGGNFKRTYRTDLPVVGNMIRFFDIQGLPGKEWTKKFIDWAFRRREEIVAQHQYFDFVRVFRVINHFFQTTVIAQQSANASVEEMRVDFSLLNDLRKADEAGRLSDLFIRFGIPTTVTYLVGLKGFTEVKILDVLAKKIAALSKGSASERQQLAQIVKISITGSPYPPAFLVLDWRKCFLECAILFKREIWWRGEDYAGVAAARYWTLLGEMKSDAAQ